MTAPLDPGRWSATILLQEICARCLSKAAPLRECPSASFLRACCLWSRIATASNLAGDVQADLEEEKMRCVHSAWGMKTLPFSFHFQPCNPASTLYPAVLNMPPRNLKFGVLLRILHM